MRGHRTAGVVRARDERTRRGSTRFSRRARDRRWRSARLPSGEKYSPATTPAWSRCSSSVKRWHIHRSPRVGSSSRCRIRSADRNDSRARHCASPITRANPPTSARHRARIATKYCRRRATPQTRSPRLPPPALSGRMQHECRGDGDGGGPPAPQSQADLRRVGLCRHGHRCRHLQGARRRGGQCRLGNRSVRRMVPRRHVQPARRAVLRRAVNRLPQRRRRLLFPAPRLRQACEFPVRVVASGGHQHGLHRDTGLRARRLRQRRAVARRARSGHLRACRRRRAHGHQLARHALGRGRADRAHRRTRRRAAVRGSRRRVVRVERTGTDRSHARRHRIARRLRAGDGVRTARLWRLERDLDLVGGDRESPTRDVARAGHEPGCHHGDLSDRELGILARARPRRGRHQPRAGRDPARAGVRALERVS